MRVQLKPLKNQVIVVTGASSGINLATARQAAAKGARIVLAARNETALREICDGIRDKGGDAIYVVADISQEADVKKIADAAIRYYGGFDTWVNGAAVLIYGKVEEVSEADHRRLFDVNYWGTVYGTQVALAHLRARGGAIINVGSLDSDRAVPLQGPYVASKHALKGFTDTLRMELEAERAPVSLTLIKPGSIDTPLIRHAKNYLPEAPMYPPPVYTPDVVADAVLYAATHQVREVMVGGAARLMATMGRLFPRLTDRLMEHTLFRAQQTSEEPRTATDNLYQAGSGGEERSYYANMHVARRSWYTSARLNPKLTAAVLAAFGVTAAATLAWRGRQRYLNSIAVASSRST